MEKLSFRTDQWEWRLLLLPTVLNRTGGIDPKSQITHCLQDAFFAYYLLQKWRISFSVDLVLSLLTEDPWCAPIKVKNGQARCRTPRGEYYKNVMGTRCNIHCNKGYEMQGHPEVLCMSSKRWSGNYACRGEQDKQPLLAVYCIIIRGIQCSRLTELWTLLMLSW